VQTQRPPNDMLFRGAEHQSCLKSRHSIGEARGIGSATLQGQYNPVRVRSSPCLRGESSAFSTSRFVCAICDDVNFADGARSFFEADFLYEQMEKRLDPPLKK
jgi:hypothetical protein